MRSLLVIAAGKPPKRIGGFAATPPANSLPKRVSMDMVVGMFVTRSLTITAEVLSLIARIDEFKGAWRSTGTIAPERLQALRHVATIENIGSSMARRRWPPSAQPRLETSLVTTMRFPRQSGFPFSLLRVVPVDSPVAVKRACGV
jgi:hypothetical protein